MKKIIFASIIMVMALGTLCSCKGRTMSNMEPTGDTVEVQIAPAASGLETDTITPI